MKKRETTRNVSGRRDFLKAAGAVTAGIAAGSPLSFAESPGSSLEPLNVWITSDELRVAESDPIDWSDAARPHGQEVVTLSPQSKFQSILGFGACFNDGACYLFNQLSAPSRAGLFHTLFHPSQMSLNACRICIGSADAAASVYSFDDGDPDPDLKRFSIDHDRTYILPVLREARAINPDLFLFGSPWSPPGWMKDNGSMLGGCMRHTYMPSYAKYFVRFLQDYAAAGVPVQAITVQNEVDADQQGLMPACFWPQDYEADFVRLHLGPEFERSGVKTQIWIIDHNYNLWGRAIAELETEGVRQFVNGIAWHGYSGEPEMMSRVQDAFPDLPMHWTEGTPDYNDPEYMKCWAVWGQKFTTILRNSCTSVTAWCFATDEHGKPNIGPYPCGGILTIDSKTHAIYHCGQFWALSHFSRFVKRGAVRIDSDGSYKDLTHVAFVNPDGSLVVILTNSGNARTTELRLGRHVASVSVPANSVMTLTATGRALESTSLVGEGQTRA
jgi:glucosylceramidase